MNQFPKILFAVLAGAVLFGAACAPKPEPATFVLTNGRLVTMDPAVPQAEALAARGDKIVAVGTAKEIARYIGPETEVVDLGGKLATPGWIDSHLHFMSVGQAKLSLDLTKVKNWDEIVAHGRRGGENRCPGCGHHRPRLAPGEMG